MSEGVLIVGDAGDNLLVGGADADTLRGLAGDDILQSGGGNDVLLGGSGIDLAVLPFDFNAQTVVDRRADVEFGFVIRNGGGRVSIRDVEILEFSNTVVDLSIDLQAVAFDQAIQFPQAQLGNTRAVPDIISGAGVLLIDGGFETDLLAEGFRILAVDGQVVFPNQSVALESGVSLQINGDATGFSGVSLPDGARLTTSGISVFETFSLQLSSPSLGFIAPVSIELVAADDILIALPAGESLAGGVSATGQPINDILLGRSGVDSLEGNGGADALFGGGGDDRLQSGGGDTVGDLLIGAAGNDGIRGASGADTLIGDGFDADIDGSVGDAIQLDADGDGVAETSLVDATLLDITGGSAGQTSDDGSDRLIGGAGDDLIITGSVSNHSGGDLEDGVGDGAEGSLTFVDANGDLSASIQFFGRLSDTAFAGDGDDTVIGVSGADELGGGGGNDSVYGQAGADILFGGNGDDRVDGGDGTDQLFGGNGTDTLFGGADNDEIAGGDGDDRLSAGSGVDRLDGGAGDDTLIAEGGGDDVLTGGIGDDVFVIGADAASHTVTDLSLSGAGGMDSLDLTALNTGITTITALLGRAIASADELSVTLDFGDTSVFLEGFSAQDLVSLFDTGQILL